MTGLASVEALQTLMKTTFSGSALDQAELVLDIVSAWARTVSNQEWASAPTGVPADVVGVVLTASRRELKNPHRVITESMGPFSVSYAQPPAGFFSTGELDILNRYKRSRNTGGLFTVSTTRGETMAANRDGFLVSEIEGEPFGYYAEGEPGWEESVRFGN